MSTDSTADSVMKTVGSSFLEWIRVGLLPYIIVTVNSIILMAGVVLNLTLIIMFKKWKHYKNPGSTLVIQLAAIDILYCVFCLPLSSVAATLKSWPFPDVVCSVYGIASTWLYNLQFGILALFAVDRLIILRDKMTYARTFGSAAFLDFICLLVYSLEFLVATLSLIPSNVTGTIAFNAQVFNCDVKAIESPLLLNMELVVCFLCPSTTYAVCTVLIAKARRGILSRAQDSNVSDPSNPLNSGPESGCSEDGPDNKKHGTSDFQRTQTSFSVSPRALSQCSISVQETTTSAEFKEPKVLKKIQTAKNVVVSLLRDDKKDEDYHLAVSYFITWFLVTALWSVRLVVTYAQVYGHLTVWSGVYIIAALIGNLSFCVKPIIYLSHNKNLKRQTKSVLPAAVRSTATKIHPTVDKLDRTLFRTGTSANIRNLQAGLDTGGRFERLDSDLTWQYKETQDVELSSPPTGTILHHT